MEKRVNAGRDISIDFLRFTGLALIIFAHCSPPEFLFQLRNFDVPLMFFVSGASLALSKSLFEKGFFSYISDRFKRLIMPTWLTLLIILFIIKPIKDGGFSDPNYLNIVLSSFTLAWGIGYIWVIRLFFLVAIAGFIFCKFFAKTTPLKTLIVIFTIMLIYQLLLRNDHGYGNICTNVMNGYCFSYILECIPYLCFFTLGFISYRLNKKLLYFISLTGWLIFLCYAIFLYFTSGGFVNSNFDKYPAGIYYISYATAIIPLYYIVSRRISFKIPSLKSIDYLIAFFSMNSLWIYLFHIIFLYSGIFDNLSWPIKYLSVTAVSALCTAFKNDIIECYIHRITHEWARKNLKKIMFG